jgi:hypothetical protein
VSVISSFARLCIDYSIEFRQFQLRYASPRFLSILGVVSSLANAAERGEAAQISTISIQIWFTPDYARVSRIPSLRNPGERREAAQISAI